MHTLNIVNIVMPTASNKTIRLFCAIVVATSFVISLSLEYRLLGLGMI